jgi:MFS superfamily sulfate permease-like transporter
MKQAEKAPIRVAEETEDKPVSQSILKGFNGVNIGAALVLLCIALPLNVGVAIACGVPSEFGIISGVIASLVTGLVSQSSFLISGPDAGIGVLVIEILQKHGLQSLGTIVFLAGLMQVLLGFASAARWFKALSPAVINGMLAGMGLLIIFTQFHIMLDDTPKESGLLNMVLMPETIFKCLTATGDTAPQIAALLSIFTIIVACLWANFTPPKLRRVPNALVAIVSLSAVACFFNLPVSYVTLPKALTENVAILSFSSIFASLQKPDIYLAAAMLAFVCSAQSLVTLRAVDPDASRRNQTHDRELIAQGIGNLLCGLLGTLPIVGVLLRSAANKQNGATCKTPNLLHGTLMVVAILAVPGLLQSIPTSVLSATLVLIGYRMVSEIFRQIKGYEGGELTIFALTAAAVVVTNLFTGVLIGFVLATGKAFIELAKLDVHLETSETSNDVTLHLIGAATFLSLPRLSAMLEEVHDDNVLHLNLEKLRYIDHACLQLLTQWERYHRGRLFIDWQQSPAQVDVLPLYARRQSNRPAQFKAYPWQRALSVDKAQKSSD